MMKNLVPRKFPIKKAQSGLALYTEADAGFPNGQEQLRLNTQRRENKEQLQRFLKSKDGLYKMMDRFYSVPGNPSFELERIPIYAEPDNTPEWIKNVYYFFNPSRKPKKYTKF